MFKISFSPFQIRGLLSLSAKGTEFLSLVPYSHSLSNPLINHQKLIETITLNYDRLDLTLTPSTCSTSTNQNLKKKTQKKMFVGEGQQCCCCCCVMASECSVSAEQKDKKRVC